MRTKRSSLNIIVGVFSLAITTFLGFILSKYFINYIGIEKNGLNSLFNNILAILSISELGIAGAINYNLYKPIAENDYDKISSIMKFYRNCYRIIGLIILFLSIFLSFFVEKLMSDYTLDVSYIRVSFLIYAINCASTYFCAYYRNLFYGYQLCYVTTTIDFFIKVIKNLFQIFLIVKYKSFILYLLVNIIFDFLSNLIIHFYARRKFKNINIKNAQDDHELKKKVIGDVKSLSVIQVTNALINFTDSLIIAKFVGIIQTGLYANYKMILNQLNNLINTIFNGVGASIGNLLAENDYDKIKETLSNLQKFCILLGIVCMSGLISVTQPFICFWLGKNFLISNSIVILIAINIYINIQRQVITYFLRTGGFHKKMICSSIVESIINLIVSCLLVFKFQIFGVLLGTVLSSLYGLISTSKILYKIYNFDYKNYIIKQLRFFIFSCIIGCLLFVFEQQINFSILSNLILNLLIYGVVIFIIIFMLIGFDKNFLYYKKILLKLIKKNNRKKVI